jgi:hypothetical protein
MKVYKGVLLSLLFSSFSLPFPFNIYSTMAFTILPCIGHSSSFDMLMGDDYLSNEGYLTSHDLLFTHELTDDETDKEDPSLSELVEAYWEEFGYDWMPETSGGVSTTDFPAYGAYFDDDGNFGEVVNPGSLDGFPKFETLLNDLQSPDKFSEVFAGKQVSPDAALQSELVTHNDRPTKKDVVSTDTDSNGSVKSNTVLNTADSCDLDLNRTSTPNATAVADDTDVVFIRSRLRPKSAKRSKRSKFAKSKRRNPAKMSIRKSERGEWWRNVHIRITKILHHLEDGSKEYVWKRHIGSWWDVERNEKVSGLLDGYLDLASVEVTPYNGYPIQLKWDGQEFQGADLIMEKHMGVSMREMECLVTAPDQSLCLNSHI